MPPAKKSDLDKLAWSWVEDINSEHIERIHLETAYRIGLKKCKSCKRNCTYNPQCLTGLGEEKYIKSQPAVVESLESSLSELRDPTQYVGLKNLGATCYVNSLIQMWFHNEDMRRIIYKWNIAEDPEEQDCLFQAKKSNALYNPVTVVGQLQYIFAMMQFGNRCLLDPTNLAIALSLDTRTQQDAQEFSKLLLCHIEGKMQQNAELKRMLQDLTHGRYSYVNCCSTCGTEFKTSTTFYELDLQLAPTLKEAIENYLSEEQLTDQNKYHCTTCNDKQDATRFIRLELLPETLNIQLMRFVFHRDSGQKRKLSSFIQFPEELDMSEYVKAPPQTHLYSLVAVLSHKGPSAHSGHYIANICNSTGEWYQFSDDKVEKIQNKRMEDGINENPKIVKRSRVPKGFFSSNTAYMLVYKRHSIEIKSINGKKSKNVKNELQNSEINSNCKTDSDYNIIADAKSDKLGSNNEKSIDNEMHVDVNNTNNNAQTKLNKEEISKIEEKMEITEYFNPSECVKRSLTTQERLGIEQQSKRLHVRLSKIDFKRLNGAAHRAMSCGERDFYENMEFEKWEVSHTMRDLIRRENVKQELSLLAVQQEKQKEIEDQNSKRQLVIDVYNIIANAVPEDDYLWIPTEWLSKWLNGHSPIDSLPPIDNSILLCPHFKLDPVKVNRAKYMPIRAAELLYNKYKGGPRLDKDSLCDSCVKKRCKMLKFKLSLERDHKEVSELMRNFKELDESSYIVGADSFKFWRRLATEKFTDYVEQEIEEGSSSPQEEGTKEEAKDSDNRETEEKEDHDVIMNFNEDLLCEHGSLKTPDSSRRIVPGEVWKILRKYFPDAKEYMISSSSCSVCEEKMECAQKAKKDDKVKAKQQKEELMDLYYGKNRNEISKCNDSSKMFYIVEKNFLDSWRSFIRYAEAYSRAPPPGIQNAMLLCESHKGFLYQPSLNHELYTIVTADEWAKLAQFYEVDYAISIGRNETDFWTNPGSCATCILARVEQERCDSLKYEKATIYIKCVDDSDEPKTESDESSAKRQKLFNPRPLRARRKVKGSHELKVSSEITLKELKVMAIPFCGAGPYDQHLMLGDQELTDHGSSLASLGVFPGALLTLKIDTPIENEVDMERDVSCLENPSPEKGFKGTELVPR